MDIQLFSTFENHIYLEMALSKLEKMGVEKDRIYAIPLNSQFEKLKLFDTVHRSDGTSLIDIGMALGTAFSVIGASIGFKLEWGPIYWGLITAFFGFVIGFLIRLYIEVGLKKKKRVLGGKHAEVILIIQCEEKEAELVEELLFHHFAMGVGKTKMNKE